MSNHKAALSQMKSSTCHACTSPAQKKTMQPSNDSELINLDGLDKLVEIGCMVL